MKEFIAAQELLLQQALNELEAESNLFTRSYKSWQAARNSILRIQEYVAEHPFADLEAEILYFKELAPPFYARFFLFIRQFNIEVEIQHGTEESLASVLLRERRSMEEFYEEHRAFYRYYFSGDSCIDDRIFVRDKAENGMDDPLEIIMGRYFCVGCYWAALLIANKLLKKYLKDQASRRPAPKIKWTKGPTNLLEVLYALWLSGALGGILFKEVVEWAEELFQLELGQYNVTINEIFNRKIAMTKFIDKMKEEMVKKAESRD